MIRFTNGDDSPAYGFGKSKTGFQCNFTDRVCVLGLNQRKILPVRPLDEIVYEGKLVHQEDTKPNASQSSNTRNRCAKSLILTGQREGYTHNKRENTHR